MFADLIDLFDGWYTGYLSDVAPYTVHATPDEIFNVSNWALYVPWPAIFGFIFLIFGAWAVIAVLRSILCRIF